MSAEEIVRMLLEADGPLHICALIDEASVHLPRRGTRWVAAFQDENGRQVWKATGQRDRAAAQAIPASISFTGLAWHALISVGVGLYWQAKVLTAGNPAKIALFSGSFPG